MRIKAQVLSFQIEQVEIGRICNMFENRFGHFKTTTFFISRHNN